MSEPTPFTSLPGDEDAGMCIDGVRPVPPTDPTSRAGTSGEGLDAQT